MSAQEESRSGQKRRKAAQTKAQPESTTKEPSAKRRRAAQPRQGKRVASQKDSQRESKGGQQVSRTTSKQDGQPKRAASQQPAPRHASSQRPAKDQKPAPKQPAPKHAASTSSSSRPAPEPDATRKERGASSRDNTTSAVSALDEGVVGRILPVLAAALALVAIVFLYRYVFPPAITEEPVEDTQLSTETSNDNANAANNVYQGVEDPYTYTGYFSTGSDELDQQVKAFCDSIADPTLDARENAKKVFQTIAGNSTYTIRSITDKPGGPEWYRVCAEQYFATSTPDQGLPGSGDFYDYASALCYCLRYFGFSDALAVPVASVSGSEFKAVVVVTDTSGTSCMCDPSQYANGFMLDLYPESFIVENIGQDTTQEETMGLTVQEVETDMTSVDG